MARGRTFEWHAANGDVMPLTKLEGYWILEGVRGLGKPIYQTDLEDKANTDGVIPRGSRAAHRQVFLPMEISGDGRQGVLDRMQRLGELTNPKNGPGYLYITDGDRTYRLYSQYSNGAEGDESTGLQGEELGEHWQRTGLVFDAIDPYFESPFLEIQDWGYGGAIPFFPLPPVRLNPNQVLSDISKPAKNNHLKNPSQETGQDFWDISVFGNPIVSYSRSPVFAQVGSWGGDAYFSNSATVHGISSAADTLVVDQQYTAHGKVYVPSGSVDVRANVIFRQTGDTITAKDQWVWTAVPFVATAATERVQIECPNGALDAGQPTFWSHFYFDKWAISEGIITSEDEYIDGDQPFCDWTGTPHESTSFREPLYEPSIVNNPGTVDAYPIWKIVGPGSTLTLDNVRTGRKLLLSLTTPLGSGEVATIDARNSTALLQDGTNLYRYLTLDDFWPLEPGSNTVRAALAGAAAGSQIILTYYPRYEAIVL